MKIVDFVYKSCIFCVHFVQDLSIACTNLVDFVEVFNNIPVHFVHYILWIYGFAVHVELAPALH